MAVNESRSMNADLNEGLVDGVVKHLTPDRGGVVEYHESQVKANLHDWWYDAVQSAAAKSAMIARQRNL